MNNYCINLKKRKGKPFCKLLNKEIMLHYCKECNKKEYKKCTIIGKKSALNRKNELKSGKIVQRLKHSTYKHRKADSTRFSIITNDLEHCIICGRKKEALHEVFYGAYRHVSIKYGMVIPLCLNHHTEGLKSLHRDRELDLYYKRLAQSIFEEKYSHDLFMKEFIINYLKKD